MSLGSSVVNDGVINSVLLEVGSLDGVDGGRDLLAQDLDLNLGLRLLGVVDSNSFPLPGVDGDDLIL